MDSAARTQAPFLPDGLEGLAELALDLRWTGSPAADALWRGLDPETWAETRNPWLILQTISRKRMEALAADPSFRGLLAAQLKTYRAAVTEPAWFQKTHADARLNGVAYFSMEFGLSESLPVYSGGLAVLAGDHLKAASDLGVPLFGVGLLYQRGYFRQFLDAEGRQTELYPYNEPSQLPIQPVRTRDGDWLRLRFRLPGRTLYIRAWQARVGRVTLYLLDSNDPLNSPTDRGITSELYGGGPELRLQQELVLGIAGWQLVRALELPVEVCHLNEGHAAFAVIERARGIMQDTGEGFETAFSATRAGNVFTTHTPVAAGFDRFDAPLIRRYLRPYAEALGIDLEELLSLGRERGDDRDEPFNMAYLAIRGSGALNGVSRLHGLVSRKIFQPLFPGWPEAEVPVGHVTNGVHTPSWASAEAYRLLAGDPVGDGWHADVDGMERRIAEVSDGDLWSFRTRLRAQLIDYVRTRFSRQRGAEGAGPKAQVEASHALDANVLTIGFARRFATYKRPDLILHDPERLARLMGDPARPVQIIVAGKAHPQDGGGKAIVQKWVEFSRRPEMRRRVVFLSDYDMAMTSRLIAGVDVWLNTPRRPWEASGTSGMKVLINGGLNLSELDGWWAEAYEPGVGWAIGDGGEGDGPEWDAREAEELYRILEDEVVREFYDRDEHGVPTPWVTRMRASMSRLTAFFSTGRMVREYAERYYLPAAEGYVARAADRGAVNRWRAAIGAGWREIRFGDCAASTEDDSHHFQCQVYLGDLEPESVEVQAFADSLDGGEPERHVMECRERLTGAVNGYLFAGTFAAGRPIEHYTPRVVPRHRLAHAPLDARSILWGG